MKRLNLILTLLPVLALTIVLAACGDASEEAPDTDATTELQQDDNMGAVGAINAPPAQDPAQPRMEDGVQVIDIEAGQMGYTPKQIDLQAGVPARLVFTRTVDSECSSQVQIPSAGIEKTDLPMNEPVAIEFTPDDAGTFTFTCGMEMQEGTIVVKA